MNKKETTRRIKTIQSIIWLLEIDERFKKETRILKIIFSYLTIDDETQMFETIKKIIGKKQHDKIISEIKGYEYKYNSKKNNTISNK
tara:strand:+ start:597 stop:857 length:261 start_codon:yes stop_codon:yes gene_type:complete